MPDLTDLLDEIQDRADRATDGPWFWASHVTVDGAEWVVFDESGHALASDRDGRVSDAKFIAHAREDVPRVGRPGHPARHHQGAGGGVVNPKMLPGETSAGFCRRMGWGPGTLIAGSEGSRRDILTITAVGEEAVLGIVRDRKPPREGLWTLRCRDWEVES